MSPSKAISAAADMPGALRHSRGSGSSQQTSSPTNLVPQELEKSVHNPFEDSVKVPICRRRGGGVGLAGGFSSGADEASFPSSSSSAFASFKPAVSKPSVNQP
jgi:hypothetical protein